MTAPASLLKTPVVADRNAGHALKQLLFLWHEMDGGHGGMKGLLCFLKSWGRGGRLVVASYRCKRFWRLLLGRWHGVSTLWMWPLYCWCRQIGGCHEIDPGADIGRGLRVVHYSMPCVVTDYAQAGENLYLTGGNVIGRRRKDDEMQRGDVALGHNVMLGIGAMVIGPIRVGDGVQIGAGTTVIKDVPAFTAVVGVPARHLRDSVMASPAPNEL